MIDEAVAPVGMSNMFGPGAGADSVMLIKLKVAVVGSNLKLPVRLSVAPLLYVTVAPFRT